MMISYPLRSGLNDHHRMFHEIDRQKEAWGNSYQTQQSLVGKPKVVDDDFLIHDEIIMIANSIEFHHVLN